MRTEKIIYIFCQSLQKVILLGDDEEYAGFCRCYQLCTITKGLANSLVQTQTLFGHFIISFLCPPHRRAAVCPQRTLRLFPVDVHATCQADWPVAITATSMLGDLNKFQKKPLNLTNTSTLSDAWPESRNCYTMYVLVALGTNQASL